MVVRERGEVAGDVCAGRVAAAAVDAVGEAEVVGVAVLVSAPLMKSASWRVRSPSTSTGVAMGSMRGNSSAAARPLVASVMPNQLVNWSGKTWALRSRLLPGSHSGSRFPARKASVTSWCWVRWRCSPAWSRSRTTSYRPRASSRPKPMAAAEGPGQHAQFGADAPVGGFGVGQEQRSQYGRCAAGCRRPGRRRPSGAAHRRGRCGASARWRTPDWTRHCPRSHKPSSSPPLTRSATWHQPRTCPPARRPPRRPAHRHHRTLRHGRARTDADALLRDVSQGRQLRLSTSVGHGPRSAGRLWSPLHVSSPRQRI